MKTDENLKHSNNCCQRVLSHPGSLLGSRSGDNGDSCRLAFFFKFEGQVCVLRFSDTFGVVTSYAQVWAAHLFKLMDLDSLPEHCPGDGPLGAVCSKRVSALLFRGHDAITPKYIPVVCSTYHIMWKGPRPQCIYHRHLGGLPFWLKVLRSPKEKESTQLSLGHRLWENGPTSGYFSSRSHIILCRIITLKVENHGRCCFNIRRSNTTSTLSTRARKVEQEYFVLKILWHENSAQNILKGCLKRLKPEDVVGADCMGKRACHTLKLIVHVWKKEGSCFIDIRCIHCFLSGTF